MPGLHENTGLPSRGCATCHARATCELRRMHSPCGGSPSATCSALPSRVRAAAVRVLSLACCPLLSSRLHGGPRHMAETCPSIIPADLSTKLLWGSSRCAPSLRTGEQSHAQHSVQSHPVLEPQAWTPPWCQLTWRKGGPSQKTGPFPGGRRVTWGHISRRSAHP